MNLISKKPIRSSLGLGNYWNANGYIIAKKRFGEQSFSLLKCVAQLVTWCKRINVLPHEKENAQYQPALKKSHLSPSRPNHEHLKELCPAQNSEEVSRTFYFAWHSQLLFLPFIRRKCCILCWHCFKSCPYWRGLNLQFLNLSRSYGFSSRFTFILDFFRTLQSQILI